VNASSRGAILLIGISSVAEGVSACVVRESSAGSIGPAATACDTSVDVVDAPRGRRPDGHAVRRPVGMGGRYEPGVIWAFSCRYLVRAGQGSGARCRKRDRLAVHNDQRAARSRVPSRRRRHGRAVRLRKTERRLARTVRSRARTQNVPGAFDRHPDEPNSFLRGNSRLGHFAWHPKRSFPRTRDSLTRCGFASESSCSSV
jgi:hypothetical protein